MLASKYVSLMEVIRLLLSLFPQTETPSKHPFQAKECKFRSIFSAFCVSMSTQLHMMRSKPPEVPGFAKGSSALACMIVSLFFFSHCSKLSLESYRPKLAFKLALVRSIILGERSVAKQVALMGFMLRAKGRSLPVPQATSRMLFASDTCSMYSKLQQSVWGQQSNWLQFKLYQSQADWISEMLGTGLLVVPNLGRFMSDLAILILTIQQACLNSKFIMLAIR